MKYQNSKSRRCGVAAVEFALVLPLFVLILLATIELSRGMMVQQVIIEASREGARHAVIPGATTQSVKNVVTSFASKANVKLQDSKISITPNPALAKNNEAIMVVVEAAVSDVKWTSSIFLSGNLRATTSMRAEGF